MPDPRPPTEPGELDSDLQPGPPPITTEAATTPEAAPAPADDPPVTTAPPTATSTDTTPEAAPAPADDPPVTTAPPTATSTDTTPEAAPAPADDPPVTTVPPTATSTEAPDDEPPSHAESGPAETSSEGSGDPTPSVDAWPAAAATVAPGRGAAGTSADEAATASPDRAAEGAGGGDDDGEDTEVDGDEPPARKDNLLTKEVRIDAKTLLGLVAAVILVGLAFGAYQLGQRQGQEAGGTSKPTSSTTFQAPKDFVPITDPETGVTISIPSNWVRYSVKDVAQKSVRLAAGITNTGDAITVRVNAYSTEITEANIADQKAVFDDILSTEDIQVVVDESTKLANLPALFYVYKFQDKATGKAGIHAQYNVFQGRKMVQLILQALPEDRYPLLASTFDAIAASLKVTPGPPPAFLEELAGTPTTTAPGAPTTTTAVGTPPSSGPATSTP